MDTPEQLIKFLNKKAHAEGFELVHKESINKTYIKFRYHLHSKYGKKQEINSNCQFFVAISRINDSYDFTKKVWHVSSSFNCHNHQVTPFKFADLLLSEEQVTFIQSIYIFGVNYGDLANVIKLNYDIDLSREHVRHVCLRKKDEHFKLRISETEELERYRISTNRIARFDQ